MRVIQVISILIGLCFLLMGYLSIKNKGAIDGPFVYFAFSVISLLYCFAGLLVGEYTRGGHKFKLDQEPTAFWLMFAITLVFGLGFLIYGLRKSRKKRHA